MKSSFGANRLEKFLKDYRDTVVKDRLAAKNLPASVLSPFAIKQGKRGAAGKGERRNVRQLHRLHGNHFVHDRAMYPAIDLYRRRERARNDGDDSVEPIRAGLVLR